jgi:hypothetical protein
MDRMGSGEAAREMERVLRALMYAGLLVRALDQQQAAISLDDNVPYSPLRTLVEQAETSATSVLTHLRAEASRE